MSTFHNITLSGCSTVPLAHYLKALGVLRILSSQRTERCQGYWERNKFILSTSASANDILEFFEKFYVPSPIVVPWSGGDFFGVNKTPKSCKWDKRPTSSRVIEAVLLTNSERLSGYRTTIRQTLDAMNESGVASKKVIEGNGTPQRAAKSALLQSLRNRLCDDAVAWIDAAAVIESRAPYFNTLLGGGGGSDGNSHFSDNFMQSLWMALPDFEDQRAKQVGAVGGEAFDSRAALFDSLFASNVLGTQIDQLSPVLFDSTRVGGPNQKSGFEAKAGSNPWDFIFMLEGSLLFAGALGRKLGDDRSPSARFPFLVSSSPVGLGASYFGESSGREAWLPVWDKPASFEELVAIFSEGRIEKHGRMAKSGTDVFVALAQHGHSSGITSFQRIGFFKGRIGGDNYFTAVDQGLHISSRKPRVDIVKDIDEWLERVRDAIQSDRCPNSVRTCVIRVESCVADLSLDPSNDSIRALLVALGHAERALANSLNWTNSDTIKIRPLSGLRPEWLNGLDGRELRLASSLAGLRARPEGAKDFLWIRQMLEPVDENSLRGRWINWLKVPNNDVTWHDGGLTDSLNAILSRRILRVGNSGAEGWSDWSPRYAKLADITAFIEGRTDDALLADLIWGLSLIDWQAVAHADKQQRSQDENTDLRYDWKTDEAHRAIPSSFYALLKLCFCRKAKDAKPIPIVPAIHQRASAGDGLAASQLAARRLRASGEAPLVRELRVASDTAKRTAAALLFPISPRDMTLLKLTLQHQTENQTA